MPHLEFLVSALEGKKTWLMRYRRDLLALFLLAFMLWISHFRMGADLGLHDEDFIRIPEAISLDFKALLGKIFYFLNLSKSEGRPMHPIGIYVSSFIGYSIGGLCGIYFLNFSVLLVNLVLLYSLLRRVYSGWRFAFIGGIAFVLFPADTTRNWLTIGFGAQPSIGLILGAIHCYLSRYRVLGYVLAALSLFWYETVFPVFWIAPMLYRRWERKMVREMIRHGSLLLIILAGVGLLRKLFGENRVNNIELDFILKTSIGNAFLGPIISLSLLAYRPIEMIFFPPLDSQARGHAILPVFTAIAIVILILIALSFAIVRIWYCKGRIEALPIVQLASVGAIAMSCAYLLSLNPNSHDVTWILGRNSRIHLAASIGISIMAGSIYLSAERAILSKQGKRIANGVLVVLVSIMIGFGQVMQANYRLSWRYQQAFWSDVVEMLGDITDGTPILLEVGRTKNPGIVGTHSFPIDKLSHIYQFPEIWMNQPEIYRLYPNWKDKVEIVEPNSIILQGDFVLRLPGEWADNPIDARSIIFLSATQDGPIRIEETIDVRGTPIQFKPIQGLGEPPYPKGVLHDHLIVESNIEDYLLP